MMFFVESLQTYSPKNKACKKLLEYVGKYKYVLIKDEISLDALKEELRIKVDEINAEYPKLKKKICFSAGNIGGEVQRIDASVDNMGCSDYVFFMDICRVRSVYQFSEKISAPQKAIEVPGVCRDCGCKEDDPCYHPDYGTCWWSNEEHTLCSHCADKAIADDPCTEHCINTTAKI
jgi:hypothetical protein